MLELRDGIRKSWQASFTHTGLHKTHKRWLVRNWNIFGARTNHGQHGHIKLTTAWTWGKPSPSPYSILCTSPWGPHPNDFVSWDSQVGGPKSPKLGLLQLWSPITLRVDLGSRCGLKKSFSPCWELFNGMSHAICRQVNRVNSRLFLVESQTSNLTPGPSFGYNLCFRCSNEQ